MIVFFGNGILGGEPQILLCFQCIVETGSRKAADGAFQVMHTLQDARAVKFMDKFAHFLSVLSGKDKFRFSRTRNLHLCSLVHITVSMSCDGDRLLPCLHGRFNTFYHDRRAEYRSVQDGTDSPVWASVHFLQIVLIHSRRIWRDGRAFYRNAVFFRRIGGIFRHLISGLVSVFQTQVVIFCL